MSGLVLEHVAAAYGAAPALGDASLSAPRGALVALTGPNGAGKSTLLKVAAGIVRPASGSASFDGEDLTAMAPARRARTVAYLAQGRDAAWPLKARRIVELGRAPHAGPLGRLSDDDAAAVDRAMAATGATSFAARPVTQLSGGERARVLAARALAVGAPVLLADEPAADLDPRHQLVVLEALKAEAARGAAVVVALHDLGLARRFADRVVVLDAGEVAAEGPPEAALSDDVLARVFGVRARGDGGFDRI